MSRPQTHWTECWRISGHHSCAKEKVGALQAELEKARLALEEIYDEVTGDRDWHIVATAAGEVLEK